MCGTCTPPTLVRPASLQCCMMPMRFYGIGAVSAINRYYGRDGIPLGAYRGPIGKPGQRSKYPEFTNEGQGWYAEQIAKRFPSAIQDLTQAEDALPVFRRALEEAADGSVTLVAVGFLTNVLDLLQSPGGIALVARKLKRVVIMGGVRKCPGPDAHCPPAEWNLAGCGGRVNQWEQDNTAAVVTLTLWVRSHNMRWRFGRHLCLSSGRAGRPARP